MTAEVHDLAAMIDVPAEGILSRTLHVDDAAKVVVLAMAEGEELSEHAAAMPAILHVLRGRADLGLGGERVAAGAGTWVHIPAGLIHSVRAVGPTVVLLTLLKGNTA